MILKTPRGSKCQSAKSNLIFELEYRSNFYLIGGLFPAKSKFSFQSHFVSYTECEYFFTCIWKFANWCIFGFKIYLCRKFFNFQIPLEYDVHRPFSLFHTSAYYWMILCFIFRKMSEFGHLKRHCCTHALTCKCAHIYSVFMSDDVELVNWECDFYRRFLFGFFVFDLIDLDAMHVRCLPVCRLNRQCIEYIAAYSYVSAFNSSSYSFTLLLFSFILFYFHFTPPSLSYTVRVCFIGFLIRIAIPNRNRNRKRSPRSHT